MAFIPHRAEKNDSDEELIKAYQLNYNQETIGILYLRYTDLVYGVCMKYLKEEEKAKDAVMNIYEELVIKLKTHQIGYFKSWLYTVAKNHCLMELRKTNKQKVIAFEQDFMYLEDFEHLDDILEKEKKLEKLEECVEALNDEQRISIRMFYLENKCYKEIASVTGKDWNKIRSLIQNGRRNLKICIEQYV